MKSIKLFAIPSLAIILFTSFKSADNSSSQKMYQQILLTDEFLLNGEAKNVAVDKTFTKDKKKNKDKKEEISIFTTKIIRIGGDVFVENDKIITEYF